MKFFVTGGAGFIGSITVLHLLEKGHAVTVFDSFEKGHRPAVNSRAKIVKGDLHLLERLKEILAADNYSAVIHFAGYIESAESMRDPIKYLDNNFAAGLNLIVAMESVGLRNIIFSSTAGVYGDGKPPYTEEAPVLPTSYYSQSKHFFEEALRAASSARGFKVVVLRYFNASGAASEASLGEDHRPETHLIPILIKTALRPKGEFFLYGTDYPTFDGTAVRDYVHVEDLAAAHVLALGKFQSSRADPFFTIYNVGSGHGYSIRQVIDMVKTISRSDFEVVGKPRRKGDWASSFADSGKIRRELGWRPERGLKEIVESAYLWHKNHPYGFPDA